MNTVAKKQLVFNNRKSYIKVSELTWDSFIDERHSLPGNRSPSARYKWAVMRQIKETGVDFNCP